MNMKFDTVTEEFDWRIKVFDNIPYPALVLTPDKIIVSANRAFLERKHTELEKVIGKTCHQVFYNTAEPCSQAICPFSKVIAEKQWVSILRRLEHDDREEEWIDRWFSPILDDNGNVRFVMECVRDVTRIITLEKTSISIRQFLDKVIQSSHNAIVATDMEGHVLLMNKAAEDLFGVSMEEAIRARNTESFYPPGKAAEIMKDLRNDDFYGKGKFSAVRVDVTNAQGEIIPVEMTGTIIYDDEGEKEVAATWIFGDLREKIAAEKKLKEALMQVNRSEKMAALGQLAAGVAHEINNPLTGIFLYANLALERLDQRDRLKKYLKYLINDAHRCKDIVKDLLTYSRQTSPTKEIFEVNSLVEQSLALVRGQKRFLNINLVKEMADDVMLIQADRNQLSQVIINLIMNAIDAMQRKGTMTFRTYRRQPDNKVYIEVSDTGCGISEENLSKVFDPFFTTKGPEKGTGLGLSTSYGIVKENGGSISIKETGPMGTTFMLEFPLYRTDEEAGV